MIDFGTTANPVPAATQAIIAFYHAIPSMTGLQEAGARGRAPPSPSAAAIGNVLPLTLSSNSRRRRSASAPTQIAAFGAGPQSGSSQASIDNSPDVE